MSKNRERVDQVIAMHQAFYRTLRSKISIDWSTIDLTMPQLKILIFLYAEGPSRMTAIATGVNIVLPSATGIIDRLVDMGLVDREHSKEDRRVVYCKLSGRGAELVAKLWEANYDALHETLQQLSDEDLETVARAYELLAASVGEGPPLGAMAGKPGGVPDPASSR